MEKYQIKSNIDEDKLNEAIERLLELKKIILPIYNDAIDIVLNELKSSKGVLEIIGNISPEDWKRR